MSNLKRHFNSKRVNQDISEMVTADRSLVLKRRIFSTLRLYTSFLGKRRRTDELVCDTV